MPINQTRHTRFPFPLPLLLLEQQKFEKPKFMLSLAFNDNGELLTGDSNGNIMVWMRGSNRPSRTIFNAHEAGVFTICTLKDGTYLTGGGKDRRIVEWDQKFNPTGREAKVNKL